MRKVKAILYVFVAFISLFGARNADAFLIKKLLAKPGIPTLKVTSIPVNILNSTVVVSTVSTVKTSLETVKMVKELGGVNFENLDEASAKLHNLALKQDGVKKLNKSAKKISESKVADIYDEESVASAAYKLFLVEPSSNGDELLCYKKQRELFYKDNVAELYTVVREIKKTFPDLVKEVEATEELFKNGGGAVGELNSNAVALDVNYQASELLDRVAKMTEELTAIQVQFNMVVSMNDSLLPLTKKEADEIKNQSALKKEKTSSLWRGKTFSSSSEVVFAQLAKEETFDRSEFTTYSVKKAPDAKQGGAFDGSEEGLEAIKNISSLKNELFDALNMHNVSTTLQSYRDVFDKYEKMKQLHAKSLELLSVSDQCSIRYLGNYYKKPEQVWSGGYMGALVNQDDMRKGFSKWLIDTYDVAKSKMVNEVALEDFTATTIDSSIDSRNLETSQKKAQSHVDKEKLEDALSGLDLQEQEAYGRKLQLLPWQISATLSRSLALDQYGENKWGKVDKPFPLWNDQKNYYNAYIDAKYANIADYFSIADLRDVELSLARAINQEESVVIEADYKDKASNNATWYGNFLSAIPTSSTNAQNGDEKWYLDVKNKIVAMTANEKTLAERKKRLKDQKQTPAVIKELADIAGNENWLKGFKKGMQDVAAGEELAKGLVQEVKKAMEKEKKEIANLDGSIDGYDSDIIALKKTRDATIKQMQNQLNQKREQLNAVKKVISDNNKMINLEEEKKIEAKEEGTKFSSSINRDATDKRIAEQKKVKGKLEAEINKGLEEIDATKVKYNKQLAEMEIELQEKLNLISDNSKKNEYTAVSNILNSSLKSSLASKAAGASTVLANLSKANSLLSGIRGYANDVVLRTRNAIFELGDDLYYPSSSALVNREHKKMIEDLRSISFEQFSSFIGGADVTASVFKLASEIFNKYLIEKVCGDGNCLVEDDEYFVGVFAKGRDFRAPKAAFVEYLPPVREAFYFDGTNFAELFNEKNYVEVKVHCDTMEKTGDIVSDVKVSLEYVKDPTRPLAVLQPIKVCTYKQYYLSKTQFLEAENYLPDVWKKVLSGRAFVEKDIDLKNFLAPEAALKSIRERTSNADFLRGGRYPCLLSSATIDVYDEAKYIISRESVINAPTCQDVVFPEPLRKTSIKDIEDDVTTSIGASKPNDRFNGSELGFIFEANKEGYFLFKNTVRTVFKRIEEINKQQEEGKKEYVPTMKDIIYGNAILSVNQFGNFLEISEQEKNYRKNLEELQIAVDEARESLFEVLRKAGFEPQENLNIANEEDYNLVKKTLHNKKMSIVNDVVRKSKTYQQIMNEAVTERLDEITNLSKALLQDNEEVISLSMALPSSAELAEKIITEKTNKRVKDEQKKQSDDAFKKEIERMPRPYCSSY